MKRPLLIAALMAMPILLWQQQAIAQTTHYVDNVRACAGLTPCYSTIMEAVSAAVPFDCIEVFPGVYREAVVLDKSNVALKAHIVALKPVIEAPPGEAAITFRGGVTSGMQVLNLVLEGSEDSGGIRASGRTNDVLVQGNVIRFSQRPQFPRIGISIIGASARVIHNTIQGGGISIEGSECVIAQNRVIDGSITMPTDLSLRDCVIQHNVVQNGEISVGGDNVGYTIEFNAVDGGSIGVSGSGGPFPSRDNVVRHNVVRRGGIFLGGGPNTIEANFVSGSTGDGIFVRIFQLSGEGPSVIRENTSVENAGCDINDETPPDIVTNVWQGNRFGTKCGAATE